MWLQINVGEIWIKKRVDKDNVGWKQNEEEDDTIWDLFH